MSTKYSNRFQRIPLHFLHFSLLCRDAEEQAEKIASEIENQPAYKERADLENGDEESRFAAVERPRSNSPDEVKANTGKYVAPGRRKNTQTGKLIRPALPLVSKSPLNVKTV